MKRICVILSLLIVFGLGSIAFTNAKLGGIMGRITPADASSSVSLVAGTDTLKAEIVQGAFTFTNLKEGVYTVFIKANAPYKDAVIEKVAVKDSATTDLGEVKLAQ
ncbi:carboxypeptidase regulatory-like domain-containing protein [Pedobacter frigidisoli]|uniref:Carboxypeptidase regulatory-like domain-containing protein n=1 Tax=Pedobacter frigidisoli TaxID=2530455 RepID=A0A4R0P9M3_9SPHI|nr:carboxypeptidase regulatory-like domain-containing protein [Pedobacter frigidisoli]TCD12837.1 carboxypeptidase regulatory-like domain-containing protein [Pedobacter frigidisoli]